MINLFDDIKRGVESRLARNSDSDAGTALIDHKRRVTYSELLRESYKSSDALRSLGMERGGYARAALVGFDSPGYVAAALGILSAGGVFVSTGQQTPRGEFAELLSRTAVDFAVVERSLTSRLAPDSAEFAECRGMRLFDAEFAVFKRLKPLEELPFDASAFNALNPAFIRFSSGTTGDSKGVVLSHETIVERTEAANSAFDLGESDRALWILPMAHHFAATIMLFLRKGCSFEIAVDATPERLLARLADGSATFAYATPYHYAKLAAAAERLGSDAPKIADSVKLLVSTAMALPEETAARFADVFGRRLNQALGIIECGLPCVNVDPGVDDALSVGTPTAGFAVEVDFDDSTTIPSRSGSDDDGMTCGKRVPGNDEAENDDSPEHSSQIGEVLIKGPGLFDAYLSPWTPLSEALDSDGFFHTGDLGFFGTDGKLRLTGRSKNVINFLGLKVFPERVEAVLNSHPGIRESRVSASPVKDFGEVPVAEFVPESVSEAPIPNPVDLTRFCAASLAAHEIPQEFVPVESLPKTPSGKIKR